MRKQPALASNTTGILTVLSVSPLEEDHLTLQAILGHSAWVLFSARGLAPASALLQQHEISVLLCEDDLLPGTWIDMLENIRHLSHPPSLIVTSRLADERLWSEALNLGAWDVLAKPFDRKEVFRSVKSGWQKWYDQTQLRVAARDLMTAAS